LPAQFCTQTSDGPLPVVIGKRRGGLELHGVEPEPYGGLPCRTQ
jgi:hypothetical protein